MKILYISPRVPFPVDQGNKVVIFNQIKYLSGQHEITLVAFHEKGEGLDGLSTLKKYCKNIRIFPRRPNFHFVNFILFLFKLNPFTVVRYYSAGMMNEVKNLIESENFDIVHVAFYYMAQYVMRRNLKMPKKTALILDTHNVEHLIYREYARLTKNLFLKPFLLLESKLQRKYELYAYKSFDKCLVLSEGDLHAIKQGCPESPVCLQLPIIETDADPGDRNSLKEEDNVLLFFGRLRYFANEDALRYFYGDIFPAVKKEIPTVKLRVIGRYPTPWIQKISSSRDVELIPYVEDLKPELKKASLIIVPVRIGGGIRLKILTAWVNSRPVVSTSIGADGLPFQDGKDIKIADTPSDFSRKIVQLLNDAELRGRIGEAGFRTLRENFNPQKIVGSIVGHYKEAIDKREKSR